MKTANRLRLILGDQLNASHSWFRQTCPETLYVIAELKQETNYTRHHGQKVCAFFAAMAAFAKALQQAGHRVCYLTLDDTASFTDLPELLHSLIEQYQATQFEYQLPDEYRLRKQLANDMNFNTGVTTQAYETEHFYLSDSELNEYFKAGKKHQDV